MAKISEIIGIYGGYVSTVDLKLAFLDPEKNRKCITSYMPIKPHRDAFEKIAHSIDPKDTRCYYLTGNFGTGKSHLCLMVANYFHNKSDTPELEGFFNNYSKVDERKAKELQNRRKNGRYLTAICDFATKDDFEEVLLRAVMEACQRENADIFPDTHYSEALRRLDKWKEESRDGTKFDKFQAFLGEIENRYPAYTIGKLKEELKNYKEEAMNVFKDIYHTIIGEDFSYDKSNLNEILKDFLSNEKFKERYEGLIILYDEFSYALKDGRISFQIFQGFAQMCTQTPSGCKPVVFLATGHKPLEYYMKTVDRDDVGVIEDRIDEISLTPEEMERIISAIITPKKEHPLWKEKVIPNRSIFNTFVQDCKRMKLFADRDAEEIRNDIIENLYPMHPMATHSLLKLAVEVGSNNRSTFKFFGGEEAGDVDGSYPWFVNDNDILDERNRLNLYTVDLLFTYFQDSLTSTNRELREAVRSHIMDYEASMSELKKVEDKLLDTDDLSNILKTMLIYNIIGVNNDVSNIAFGLYAISQPERESIQNRIKTLTKKNILYYDKVADTYEFRHSGSVDFESLIDAYKKDDKNIPSDIISAFNEAVPLDKKDIYLKAKKYNTAYNEDKRLKRRYALPPQLESIQTIEGKEVDYFTYLEREITDGKNWKDGIEGFVVYVFCEDDGQIQRAKEAVRRNKSEKIIVAVPNEPLPIMDALLDYNAVKSIQSSKDYETYSMQDKARLSELIGNRNKGYMGRMYEIRTKYIEGRNAVWYGKEGSVLYEAIKELSDPADKLMDQCYKYRNKASHSDLNLSHPTKAIEKNIRLGDAINRILSAKGEIEIDRSYAEDKGEIRYLNNLLVKYGVLKESRRHEGNRYFYSIETDTSKFKDIFPALADMIEEVKRMKKSKLMVRDLIRTFADPPYGLGPSSLALFLTSVFKIFGDSIRLKKDETTIGNISVSNFNIIIKILKNDFPNAFLIYKEITPEEKNYLNELYDMFSEEEKREIEDKSTLETYNALATWWNSLLEISKADMYNKKEHSYLEKFRTIFNSISQYDPYSFLFEELQTIYGFEKDDLMTEKLKEDIITEITADKEIIDGRYTQIKEKILDEIRDIFEIKGKTDQDIQESIREWYNGLDSNQRDIHASWHNNESKTLCKHLKSILNIEETLFNYIPAGFGLSEVSAWTTDKTAGYINKFKSGKKTIEEEKIKVKEPTWKDECSTKIKDEKTPNGVRITYRRSAKLRVSPPDTDVKVYVTNNSEDPASITSQREEIRRERIFEINNDENPIYKMISQDADGNFSRLIEVSFFDEDQKHQIKLPPLGRGAVQFVLPEDKESLLTSVKTLLESCLRGEIVDKKQIAEVLEEIRREYEE